MATLSADAPAAAAEDSRPVVVRGRFSGWRSIVGSFVAARLIVVAVILLLGFLNRNGLSARPRIVGGFLNSSGPPFGSLLSWDASWYENIARFGYTGLPHESIRFFPLLPALTRLVSPLAAGHTGVALLVVCNAAALAYGAVAYRLALFEGFSDTAARRVPWVIALSPAAFVLVMGYTEPVYGLLVVAAFYGMRSRNWLLAALAGALIGAIRPTGVIIGLPLLIEAARGIRRASSGERALRLVAVAAPAIGLIAYFGYVGHRFGDPLLPVRIQTTSGLRSGLFVDPIPALKDAIEAVFGHGHALISPLVHLVTVLVALALLVYCARRLPVSYTAFAAVSLFFAATARGLQSVERYAASILPLMLAAALWLNSERRQRGAAVVAALVFAGASILALAGLYVP